MRTRFFDGIDWPQAASLLAAADWRAHLNSQALRQQLTNHRELPLRFIQQEELPEGVAYEAHINASGQVPTHENP